MPSVSEVLKTTQNFPRMRALSPDELLAITSRLVQAEEVERLLEMLEGYDAPDIPKYIAPAKPTKRKARAAIVRSTGEMVNPVGRKPRNVVYIEVDTREQAYYEACREMK